MKEIITTIVVEKDHNGKIVKETETKVIRETVDSQPYNPYIPYNPYNPYHTPQKIWC